MNENEARTVLIVRAFEAPVELPWTAADADAVTREAARDAGESAAPAEFIARRAAIAAGRLAERDTVASTALRSGIASIGGSLAFVAIVIAFGIGFASDSVAENGRINILAPPLLGLIAWNLAVYAAFLMAWLRRRHAGPAHPLRIMLADAVQRWMVTPRRASGPWLRFARDWSQASRPLQAQRISALLHGGAVAFACGALASLYLRGLVFEYRAGWDSTFLTPAAVHGWLSLVLGPAAALTSTVLPSPDVLAGLRFSNGGGENAARWIHLYAITVAGLVIWPRSWLAAAALRRVRRLSTAFPIDLQGGYFQRLLRGRGGRPLNCRLLPYGLAPEAATVARLTQLIERASGQRASIDLLAPVAPGDEDEPRVLDDGGTLLLLFALSATPERETHGRLVDGLRTARHGAVVIVDEASFARRFAASAPHRVDERREAWRRMLGELGVAPVFVDLSTETADEAALMAALESSMA